MKRIQHILSGISVSLFTGALLLGLVGCVKNDQPTPDPGGETDNLPVFTFATKATYTLNVKYDVPAGYQVYFEVYPENPFTTDADGGQVKKSGLEPVDKGFTDASGKYSNPITVPAAVEELYIYSPYVGVPQLLVAKVQDNTLTAAALPVLASTSASHTKSLATRADNTVSGYNYPGIETKLLGTWTHYVDGYATLPNISQSVLYGGKAKLWGRPDYLAYVDQANFSGGAAALQLDAAIFQTINTVLPGEGGAAVDPSVLQNGDIHVTKQAEIDLYLLDEQCLNLNVLAYYCYPTGHAPSSAADIKVQTIAFPDAKIIRSHSYYFTGTDIMNYGAMRPGEGIRLHYFDANGIDQGTTFPAGTSIGWILYSNGYSLRSWPMGQPGVGEGAVYSDPALMGGIPHVAVFRHGDFVISGFEDGKKTAETDVRDYNDLVFHVGSTPADAITPGIPDMDPEKPQGYEVTSRGILSFEDNWPYQGDFDMNDVVVQYVSTMRCTTDNTVTGTTDSFTVLWSGAAYNNDFAYQNDNMGVGQAKVTITGGDGRSTVDNSNNIIRLATQVRDYANQGIKKTFTVETEYGNPVSRIRFVLPPYNPFIAIKGDQGKEVHLTNLNPTSYADTKWFGYGHDKSQPTKGFYYITYDDSQNQMPFAIDMAFDSDEEMAGYVIPKETEHINRYYPGFMKWVQSGGKTNKDWYLHPVAK